MSTAQSASASASVHATTARPAVPASSSPRAAAATAPRRPHPPPPAARSQQQQQQPHRARGRGARASATATAAPQPSAPPKPAEEDDPPYVDEFDLPSGEDTDVGDEELEAASSDDDELQLEEQAPPPLPAPVDAVAAETDAADGGARVAAHSTPPPAAVAPTPAPVATVPSRLLLGLAAKRGLGPLRADSAFYSSNACGVGVGTALSERWVRTQGPQAVVLCERSRDRATEARHAQRVRLATLVAEEASRAQREAERQRRNEERRVAASALLECSTLQRQAESATAAAVRAEARKFELRAARRRKENLEEKIKLSHIGHDERAARADKLSERRLATGASSTARRLDQLRAAKIRAKVDEARKARDERETLLERSVHDALPDSLVVAAVGDEEEKTEESSPRKRAARKSDAPLSPHRPPSKMHASRAVMLDTNSPRSRSRSRPGTTPATTAFPPIAGADAATEGQQQQQPVAASTRPSPAAAAPSKALLWADVLPCSQAIVPRRDPAAKAARAQAEAAALKELHKRAQQIRRNQARMRVGRPEIKGVAAAPGAGGAGAVKKHVIGSSSARPAAKEDPSTASPSASTAASFAVTPAAASASPVPSSSSPAPVPPSELPD